MSIDKLTEQYVNDVAQKRDTMKASTKDGEKYCEMVEDLAETSGAPQGILENMEAAGEIISDTVDETVEMISEHSQEVAKNRHTLESFTKPDEANYEKMVEDMAKASGVKK